VLAQNHWDEEDRLDGGTSDHHRIRGMGRGVEGYSAYRAQGNLYG
jgi:hypothetical protein